jgi:hypothetical protein
MSLLLAAKVKMSAARTIWHGASLPWQIEGQRDIVVHPNKRLASTGGTMP